MVGNPSPVLNVFVSSIFGLETSPRVIFPNFTDFNSGTKIEVNFDVKIYVFSNFHSAQDSSYFLPFMSIHKTPNSNGVDCCLIKEFYLFYMAHFKV